MFRSESPDYEDLLQMYDEAIKIDAVERKEQRKKVAWIL
jgi:hypothetical protein